MDLVFRNGSLNPNAGKESQRTIGGGVTDLVLNGTSEPYLTQRSG